MVVDDRTRRLMAVKAKRMYERGISMDDIAYELDINKVTLQTWMRKFHMGVGKKKKTKRNNRIFEQWKGGSSISELAKEYGVTNSNISRILLKYREK